MNTQQLAFLKTLERIAQDGHSTVSVFEAFTILSACALAMGTRESEYEREAKRWDANHLELFSHAFVDLSKDMTSQPYEDLLGPTYMQLRSKAGRDLGGEFYTPQTVALMSARMSLTMQTRKLNDGPITIQEPACGSGVMILALAQALHQDHNLPASHMRVTAWDISRIAVHMAFINLTLWGIPARVIHGDSLSLKTFDVLQNFFWLLAPPAKESRPNLVLGGNSEPVPLFKEAS